MQHAGKRREILAKFWLGNLEDTTWKNWV